MRKQNKDTGQTGFGAVGNAIRAIDYEMEGLGGFARGLTIEAKPGEGLRLQTRECYRFLALQTKTILTGVDALQRELDTFQLLGGLLLIGERHLLLLDGIDT